MEIILEECKFRVENLIRIKHATRNTQLVTCNSQLETRNTQHATPKLNADINIIKKKTTDN